jgi:FHA domain-containing protein/type VI secretion system protein
MPVKLLVKRYRERALVAELSCLIHHEGTLGRGPGNDLVLEDPGKYISRSHARVECRDGDYYLSDIGSNPSVLNGRLLGNGRETALQDGDQLVIGDYQIDVRVLELEPVDPDQTGTGQANTQTLAVFALPRVVEPKPLAPLQAPSLRHSESGFRKPELQADGLADASILQGVSVFTPTPDLADPLGLALFGAGPGGQQKLIIESADTAPLVPASRGAESDHLSPELHALPVSAKAAPGLLSVPLIPDGYDPLADLLTPAQLTEPAQPPAQDQLKVAETAQSASTLNSSPIEHRGPVSEGDDKLFRALLAGLGLPGLNTSRSPEALARLVGEMLREATAGTMGVLMARALTKRESHIDMTMIGARSNNPLKFFPDPRSALSQMLSADAPAYLPAVQALNAAFDDLKAHELAVIAGMREALSEVVQRFEPARIESRLTPPGAWDRLMPSGRKARLWERLTELYSELVRDGDEDLQRIFGEKFSAAYQQQVVRLREAP